MVSYFYWRIDLNDSSVGPITNQILINKDLLGRSRIYLYNIDRPIWPITNLIGTKTDLNPVTSPLSLCSVYFEHSQYYTPTQELSTRPNGGVAILKNKKVVKIDPSLKVAFLDDGTAIRYNKCLLATGGLRYMGVSVGLYWNIYIQITYVLYILCILYTPIHTYKEV